jgi:signal transduction histidine kinase
MLDDLGLVAALEWQSAEFEKRFGINTEFSSTITHVPFPDQYKTGLFRIFQESLTNVARHAGATRVVCTLAQANNNILLTISDNGNGFSPLEKESNKTFGLFGMKERTLAMGGNFEIKSLPGAGTSILITVPLLQ